MTGQYDADAIRSAQSLLFVPGNRPERFEKAVATQADVVILDLEDAVAPDAKDSGRRCVAEWLAAGRPGMVRINAADTRWHGEDVELIRDHRAPVMLAKAESADQIQRLAAVAPEAPVVPLIETATAMLVLPQLCAVPNVTRIAFGSIDFANQIGVDPADRQALLLHRSMMVLASAAAGLPAPIDGVTTTFTDSDAITDDVKHARQLGMRAKLCIHPAQVGVVHAAASPTAEELEWARGVLDASQTSHGSAAAVDGQMVDVPVVERARRILAAASTD
jgi:citrate lyase subunit beta/citryl-CoA lyase